MVRAMDPYGYTKLYVASVTTMASSNMNNIAKVSDVVNITAVTQELQFLTDSNRGIRVHDQSFPLSTPYAYRHQSNSSFSFTLTLKVRHSQLIYRLNCIERFHLLLMHVLQGRSSSSSQS